MGCQRPVTEYAYFEGDGCVSPAGGEEGVVNLFLHVFEVRVFPMVSKVFFGGFADSFWV